MTILRVMGDEWVSSVRVSAPALMRVSSPGQQRAAPAWDTGEQTSRPRHQGRGSERRKNPSANLGLTLSDYTGSQPSRQWAVSSVPSLYNTVPKTSPGRAELREPDIEYDHHNYAELTASEISIRQETTETCCCFSEVSDSCQQQQQQQQHLLASQLWWTPDLRSPEWWQVNGEYTLIVIV